MAYLDWIRNRGKQQAVAPKPQQENAKQMYAREAAQERATGRGVSQMPAEAKAAAKDVRTFLENYGKSVMENPPALNMTDVEGATSPQPMRQSMVRQHIHPPALSPTSGQSGLEHQHSGPPASETPAVETPKQTPTPPQPTVPRRPPSWER